MRTLILALALLAVLAPAATAAEAAVAPAPSEPSLQDCTGLVCDLICAVHAIVFPGRPCPIA